MFCPFCCPHTALIVPLLLSVHRVNSAIFLPFTTLIVPFWRSFIALNVLFSDGTLPFWKTGQNTAIRQSRPGVCQENSWKMTVTGMNLRDLNVLLLHYPFMSNPRYCLGCATQKIDLHSFIFFLQNCNFCVPYITPFCQFCVNQEEMPNFPPSVQKIYPACAQKEVLFHWCD